MAAAAAGGFLVGLLLAHLRLRHRHRFRFVVTLERDDDRSTEPDKP